MVKRFPKYIAIADLKNSCGERRCNLQAANLLDAMNEAEWYLEEAHTISIAEKCSPVYRRNGFKCVKYYRILINRGAGWHVADEAHDEFSAMWERLEDKEGFARINILEYDGKE